MSKPDSVVVEKKANKNVKSVANKTVSRRQGYWADAWRRFARNRLALFGGFLVICLFIMAIFAPWIAPYAPNEQHREGLSQWGAPLPSNADFWLGTDTVGRDLLSRVIWGSRVSLTVGVFANGLACIIGVLLGGIAGFWGGWLDVVIMRTIDVIMGYPALLLAVGLVTIFAPSIMTIIIVISIIYWTYLARVVYGQVRALKEETYVMAARAQGLSNIYILLRHILPHTASVLIVYVTFSIASAVLLESMLSYVGLGIQPPTPSWGNMISEGQYYFRTAPWLLIYPGIAIVLTVLGFNLLGDGLRDALDPQQRGNYN